MILKMFPDVIDIKHLLHFQDDFRDTFYRIIVLFMALVLYLVLDYPRRILRKTIDKYIEILEAMKMRFRLTQQNEYFLVKRVLYEQKTRDKQNIFAAALKGILKEVNRTQTQEKNQKEIMMDTELKPIEEKKLPPEPKSISPRGRKRPLYKSIITKTRSTSVSTTGSSYKSHMCPGYLEQKTKYLSKIKINKNEDVVKTNKSEKNESNKSVSSQECGESAEHFSPPHPSSDMQKIPLTIPATIVANCEINSVLFDVIQDFDSTTFPFFNSNWQRPNKIYSSLNKRKPSFTLSKKVRDNITPSTHKKISYTKNESKDNYEENVNKYSETLKTKHSNQRPSDSSIYRVRFNSREKIKKRYTFSKIAKFLEPKFWFKHTEIWERRCRYVLAKLIGPKGEDSLLGLFSLFNKHSHIPIIKPSLFSLRKEVNIKNDDKSINEFKKTKSDYLDCNQGKKVIKLNSNLKKKYGGKKLSSNKQNFHELFGKGNKFPLEPINNNCIHTEVEFKGKNSEKLSECAVAKEKVSSLTEKVAISNCFGTCDISTNSSDIDDCFCMEDLNSSLSDGSEFSTINNTNFSQIISEVDMHPQASYHSQFLVEMPFKNKYKKVEGKDHLKTKLREKCLFRDRQETASKINKQSEFSFEESDSLKIWEGLDDHSEVSISRTASKGYEGCEESDQTGYLRDEDSIPSLEDTGNSVKYGKQEVFEKRDKVSKSKDCKKTDKVELLEETDPILKDVNSSTTTISNSHGSCTESAESNKIDPLEDEGSNSNENLFTSRDYKSYAECDRWQLLGETDEDLNSAIRRPASREFKKCMESHKLEPVEEIDEESYLETSIQTSNVFQICAETDSTELVETIYQGNNLLHTSTSTFNSQSSADSMEQYQPNEVEEEETGSKLSYVKPNISTIHEVTEESASSNSLTESEIAKKIFLETRDGLTGIFNSDKKVPNTSLMTEN